MTVPEPGPAGARGAATVPGGSTDLRRHVPRIALDWDDDAPGRTWQQADATLVFADISGFTALTEKLARRGRIGAEELIETLNRIFGGILSQAAVRGGELLKFGGDALLFVFRGDDHAARACRSAVDMRTALRAAAATPTSVGRLSLSISIGVHSGPVDFFLVGSPTRELLVLGGAATSTAEAEHAAVAGEILLTTGTAQRLPGGSVEPRPDGLHRLRWRRTRPPEGDAPPAPAVQEARLRTLFPHDLGDHLGPAVPEPEHKLAAIAFARFSGTDDLLRTRGPDAVGAALHETVSVFEEAMNREGVSLLATDLDSDGGKLFMASGVPYSTEDDEGRMLRAMRAVLDRGTPLPVQIGVNRGHVFAAEVGTPARAAYSAMGDTTNTAARIMSKAPAGSLFAHPQVLEHSRTLFATAPVGPFVMKGKAAPVPVFAVGEELGARDDERGAGAPLIGRDDELAAVRAALVGALEGGGGVLTIAGATGTGKSRILAEALDGLGASVVTVRAEPYGMTSPYRMLRDPVRRAFGVERADPDAMAAQLLATFRERMPDRLALAPLLEPVVMIPIPDTPESSVVEARFRPGLIADLMVRLISSSVPGRFVLVVEEAHWADAASSAVLAHVATAAQGRPWAVVVVRRGEGAGLELEHGPRVELGPIADDVLARFVIGATAAAPLRPHEVDAIVARAEGNPLYAEELVRAFREVGSLEAMPESLHAALDAQVDALDPGSRRLLRYASVLGRSFRTEVLAETLREDDVAVDAASLGRLADFLELDGPGRMRFRNSMIRDSAYDGLAFRTRATLHGAAGRAVEALSSDLDADADTLSLHFSRAGDDARTWVHARRAGRRAQRAYANTDAAVQFQRAYDAALALGDVPLPERREVLVDLVEVCTAAGLFDQALDAVRRGARLAAGDPEWSATFQVLRMRILNVVGDYRAALRVITTTLRTLEPRDTEEARRLRARLVSGRALIRRNQGQWREARAASEGMLDEVRRAGDVDALVATFLTYDIARFVLGEHGVGALAQEALDIARRERRLSGAAEAAFVLGNFRFLTGRWREAVELYEESRRVAAEAGDLVYAATAGANLAELLLTRSELERCEGVLDDALRAAIAAGAGPLAAHTRMLSARLQIAQGRYELAEETAVRAEEDLLAYSQSVPALEARLARAESLSRRGIGDRAWELVVDLAPFSSAEAASLLPRAHLERARAELVLGRLDAALADVDAGLAAAREQGSDFEELRLVLLRGEVATAAGDRTAAAAAAADAAALRARIQGEGAGSPG